MNIHLTKLQLEALQTFEPQEGTWEGAAGHEQVETFVADEIKLRTGLNVSVQLFRENGEHLQGDERSGTMLITRI